MVLLLDTISLLYGSFFVIRSLKGMIKGSYNFYTILVFLFYFFQFVPLIFDHLYSEQIISLRSNFSVLYKALIDPIVAIIYDCTICFVITVLYYLSTKKKFRFKYNVEKSRRAKYSRFINIILIVIIFFPIVLIFYAPDPYIYLQWAYQYTVGLDLYEEIYHNEVLMSIHRFSTFALIIYYAQNKKMNLIFCIGLFFLTWISFKRTILVFVSIFVVVFDFFSNKYAGKAKKFFLKAIVLFFICGFYFVAYSEYTGKGSEDDYYTSYTLYYSRHYCVKTAIYDQLYTNKMLEYRGQTLLFDVFFWAPRFLWENKPAMYSKYFTAYSQGNHYVIGEYVTNIYVNIWAEFISNLHLLGVVFALLFIYFSIKYLSKLNSYILYYLGLSFILFYFFWGVQPFTMIIISAWLICFVGYKVKRFFKFSRA